MPGLQYSVFWQRSGEESDTEGLAPAQKAQAQVISGWNATTPVPSAQFSELLAYFVALAGGAGTTVCALFVLK